MALWAYKAYENQYYGENGIVTYGIVEGSEGLARQEAFNAACDLMESYTSIMEDIEQCADYYEVPIEDEMAERADYKICELSIELIAGRNTQELDEILNDIDFEDFRDRFGIK